MNTGRLDLFVSPGRARDWFSLLRDGFALRVRTGILPRVLEQGLGMDREFLEREVRTIFLNGHPVDHMDTARVRPGDTIALAGAMPGLVGACMRRDSPFSGFRNSITYNEGDAPETEAMEARIRVKLFNTVADAKGRDILLGGVEIAPAALLAMASISSLNPLAGVARAAWNNAPLDPADIPARLEHVGENVSLSVREE